VATQTDPRLASMTWTAAAAHPRANAIICRDEGVPDARAEMSTTADSRSVARHTAQKDLASPRCP
jgi:hypothetical protein